MSVYRIDPLRDGRWVEFLNAHPGASIFHTRGWLETLQRTYGYEPCVLTTCAPGAQLTNGIAFCRIKSWLTGERMVSVPFADHCQPLFDNVQDCYSILEFASRGFDRKRARKHIEIRPVQSEGLELAEETNFHSGRSFRLHLLDLRPSTEELLKSFDRNSVQRRLRRVTRENLAYEQGNSDALLQKFYRLQILTRRRHQIPPQPISWFKNLLTFLGENVKIRVVSKDGTPIASILTLSYNGTVVYKYGCSDAAYNNLAGTPLLFWRTIQEAKERGFHTFDMGRSDLDNPGLINFKSNWGTSNLPLTYWRCPQEVERPASAPSSAKKAGSYVISRLPDPLLIFLGRTLYKHVG
jgi:CelD/BcsL family acetyltransferase involved in cellulose biosynthesis